MKKIAKRAKMIMSYCLIDILMIIEFVIDLLYKLMWLCRYGLIKGIKAVVTWLKQGLYEKIEFDKSLTEIALEDAEYALKIEQLRSNEEKKA